MKNFLIYVGAFALISFEAHALKLYLVSNHDNHEDHNQALGIGTAFETLSPEKVRVEDLNAKVLTSLDIKDKIEKDLLNEKVVFIGTGEGGIDGIIDLPMDPNLVIFLVSADVLERHKDGDLLKKMDFIALPNHVASSAKEELGEKLIETTGLAHNRRPDMTTYDEYQKELPPADVYLGVYLGGDAPTQTKELQLFTEEDATRLANYVIVKANEINGRGLRTCVLILNSPQTGKHDAHGQEILTAHREGKSDHITELFGNKLAEADIEYKIFDSQHTTPENERWVRTYDAFDLIAGAVRTTKGKMFVPGEATSVISEAISIMPSESIDTMPPGKVLVYHNAAMNDRDRTHVTNVHATGNVSILENYENIIPASDTAEVTPSANKVIAEKVVKVTFAQAPWTAKNSLYRRTKNQEANEKSMQDLIQRIRVRADKNQPLLYGLINSQRIP